MTDLSYRLDDFGRRLAIMEQELGELRLEHVAPRDPVVRVPVLHEPRVPASGS